MKHVKLVTILNRRNVKYNVFILLGGKYVSWSLVSLVRGDLMLARSKSEFSHFRCMVRGDGRAIEYLTPQQFI